MPEYVWIVNPDTGEPERVSYDELDQEVYPQLFHPIGGFCYRVSDFTRLDLPVAPFYVKTWLPKHGKTIIYAPPKTGKSFLCQQLARCVASGEDFLGLPTTKGRVLYMQFELGEEIIQGRFRMTGKNYDEVYVGTTFSMKLDVEHGQKALLRAIDFVQPNVLILDPFYKIIKGDENESHDVGVITDFLDRMMEGYRDLALSVIVVHHMGKDLTRGARGSSVLEGWVDSYIEMRRIAAKDDPRKLRVKITPKLLRHAELPPEPLEAEMNNFEFELVGRTLTVRDKVYEWILNESLHGRTSGASAMVREGVGSRKSVTNALEALVLDGLITKVARGEYIIPTETPSIEPKDSEKTDKIDFGDD